MPKIRDIFISFNSKDEQFVHDLVERFKDLGFSVWKAPESITPGGNYAAEIEDVIHGCKIMVFILSDNSAHSEHCPKEIDRAINYRKDIIPFQISVYSGSTESGKSYNYYLTNVQRIDAMQNTEDAIERLIKYLSEYLSGEMPKSKIRRGFLPDNPDRLNFNVENSKLVEILPRNNNFFEGTRQEEINEIESLLDENRFLVVTGIGGAGKSELAKGYAHAMKDLNKYSKIQFITYNKNLENTIASLKYEDSDDNDSRPVSEIFVQNIKQLIKNEPNSLIIIDNCNERIEMLDELFNEGSYHILFTSRYRDQEIPTYQLDRFKSKEMEVELFLKNRNLLNESEDEFIPQSEREIIKEIINLVGGHPLAIELLAKTSFESNISFKKLKKKLQKINFRINAQEEISFNKQTDSQSYAHFEGCIDQLIQDLFDLSELSEDELNALRFLVFLPVNGLPLDEFQKLSGIKNLTALNRLVRRSLVKRDRINNQNIVYLHPLVQKVIFSKLQPTYKDCQKYFEKLAKKASKQLKNNVSFIKRIPIAEMINNAGQSINHITKKNVKLVKQFIDILFQNNYFLTEKKLLNKLVKWQKEEIQNGTGSVTQRDINESYIKLARIEYQNENSKAALKLFEKTKFDDFNLNKTDDLEQLIDFLSYKGWAYFKDENPKAAIKLFEIEAELFNKYITDDTRERDLKLANYLFNYGVILYNIRDLELAKEKLYESLSLYDKYFSKDHSERCSVLNELAFVSLAQNDIQQAYDLFKEAFDIRRKILGENHIHTATSYDNMACVLLQMYHQNRDVDTLIKAMEHSEKAVAIRRNLQLGTPLYARALLNNAMIYTEIFKGKDNFSKEIHPNEFIVCAYKAQKSLDRALPIIKKRPRDYADYLEAQADFEIAQSNNEEAKKFYEECLLIRSEILGEEHSKVKNVKEKLSTIS